MVVTLGETTLDNASSDVETTNGNPNFGESIDALGHDNSAVKVVKVDQIENQDLGSPL